MASGIFPTASVKRTCFLQAFKDNEGAKLRARSPAQARDSNRQSVARCTSSNTKQGSRALACDLECRYIAHCLRFCDLAGTSKRSKDWNAGREFLDVKIALSN